MQIIRKMLLALVGLVCWMHSAGAAIINDPMDPLLDNAQIIDFSELPVGSLDPTILGVSFVGDKVPTVIDFNDYAAILSPPMLSNNTTATEGTSYVIHFSSGVEAFGLEAFGVNSETVLEAFDIGSSLLGTTAYPTNDRFGLHFLGLGGFSSSITSIRVNTSDAIFFDNLHFSTNTGQVPLPGTGFLFLIGAVGIVASRTRFRSKF